MYRRGDKILYRGSILGQAEIYHSIYKIRDVDDYSTHATYCVGRVGWLYNGCIIGKVVGNRIVQRGDGCV